eukprot:gene20881-27724_t
MLPGGDWSGGQNSPNRGSPRGLPLLSYNYNDCPQFTAAFSSGPSGNDLSQWIVESGGEVDGAEVNRGGSTYISQLPVGVTGIPMFFSGECITAIEYPPVSEQIKKRCRWLFDFSKVLAKLPETPAADPYQGVAVDLNALVGRMYVLFVGWAMACITSRAFRTRGPDHPAAMLPLIDMANHSFTPNCEVKPTDNGGIGMFAMRELKAGDTLQLSYGSLMNDFLFMDYGFLVNDNPYDRVQLRFSTDMLQTGADIANIGLEEPLAASGWRKDILQKLDLAGSSSNLEVTFGGPQHADPRLLAAARVLVARSEDDVRVSVIIGHVDPSMLDKPLNKLNETAALRMLSGMAAMIQTNHLPLTVAIRPSIGAFGAAGRAP